MATRSQLTARPTTYKGVRMRSRTEARYAATLDVRGMEWEYEPQCFASEDGQYLPDFKVTERGSHAYVEVKGTMPADIEAVQRQMEIIWASEPDAPLMIVVTDTTDIFHCHPATSAGEWFHWWPPRDLLDVPPAPPKPPPAPPSAEDAANLVALREARAVLAERAAAQPADA